MIHVCYEHFKKQNHESEQVGIIDFLSLSCFPFLILYLSIFGSSDSFLTPYPRRSNPILAPMNLIFLPTVRDKKHDQLNVLLIKIIKITA